MGEGSEGDFRELIERSPDGVLAVREGRYVYVNAAFAAFELAEVLIVFKADAGLQQVAVVEDIGISIAVRENHV